MGTLGNGDRKQKHLAEPTRLAVLARNLRVQKNTKRNCTLGNGDRKRLAEPMRLAVMARNLHDVTCGVKKSKSLILKRVGSDQHIFIKLFRANAAGCVGSKPTFGHPVDLKKNVGSKQTCATGIFRPCSSRRVWLCWLENAF
jgi:hypothetical protein